MINISFTFFLKLLLLYLQLILAILVRVANQLYHFQSDSFLDEIFYF